MEKKITAIRWLWIEYTEFLKSAIDDSGAFIISEEEYMNKLMEIYRRADMHFFDDLISAIDNARMQNLDGKQYLLKTYGVHTQKTYLN